MRLSYELYIRQEVFQALNNISEPARDRILNAMESLPENPFKEGDFTTRDDTGRPVQVELVGEHALYYWADHAAKEVRLVDLIDADQASLGQDFSS